jgi:hypothetical protein
MRRHVRGERMAREHRQRAQPRQGEHGETEDE